MMIFMIMMVTFGDLKLGLTKSGIWIILVSFRILLFFHFSIPMIRIKIQDYRWCLYFCFFFFSYSHTLINQNQVQIVVSFHLQQVTSPIFTSFNDWKLLKQKLVQLGLHLWSLNLTLCVWTFVCLLNEVGDKSFQDMNQISWFLLSFVKSIYCIITKWLA